MAARSMRSLGLLPMANFIGVLTLEVTCVFLTVDASRINWARVICARVVWSRLLEVVSTRAKRFFLNNRTPHCAFDGTLAYHEDGGRPCLHKLLSDSSRTCPSTHEAQQ